MPQVGAEGLSVWYKDEASAWIEVSLDTEIEMPSLSYTERKRTHLKSPNKAHESAAGLLEANGTTIKFFADKAQNTLLHTLSLLRKTRAWVFMWDDGTNPTTNSVSGGTKPNGTAMRRNGWIKEFKPTEGKVDEDLMASLTINFTGPPTWDDADSDPLVIFA